jgi:peptidyl-prolyl cis-trans isomerase SurA
MNLLVNHGRILALVIALSALVTATVARAELIDRVVAGVNNDVITLSDLRQALAFNLAVGGKGNGNRIEQETLEGLINRRLLVQEAERVRVVEVSVQDVAAERERLKTRIGSEDAYRAFLAHAGLTEARLDRMLEERLLVERFVKKKIGLFARVSHEEAESYYAEHAAEFKGKRFPEAQAQIMAVLSEQKAGQQLDQYLADLRARAEIRINPLKDE